mgnify:CR=1 FL=1
MMRLATLTNVLLVRPGATDFDAQGRMKGSLDVPLSDAGAEQADALAKELGELRVRTVFCAPCESARETARRIVDAQRLAGHDAKVKVIDGLRNLDHGLWHGKLVDEVRRHHRRVYRIGSDRPEDFCPPEGESVNAAKTRVIKTLKKCLKKGRDELIALVIPEPLASIVEALLRDSELTSLWKNETDTARWSMIETDL